MLGLAFLIQFLTSFISGVFVLPSVTGVQAFGLPLGIDQIMANIAKNEGLVRVNILIELITGAGVIFLGAMLFSAVKKCHEGLALTAFGLYVMEGVILAVSQLALFALLVTSRNFVGTRSPESMAEMARLIYDIMEYSYKIANFAFCIGGTIFYAMLLKARTVARPLSLWGLISAQGVFAGLLLGLLGLKAPVFLYILYIPFEFVIAVWILIKGINKEKEI
jgi:hypothetical protein